VVDLPDWTTPIRVKGTDVMVAIDVQGGYIMLPVDFQDQFAGMYLQPEWATKEGVDKNLRASDANVARLGDAEVLYIITAGKTLYITHVGGQCAANLAADADKEQMCYVEVYDITSASTLLELGGNGGVFANLAKTLKVAGEHQIRIRIYNYSNHNCDMAVHAGGYEV